MNSVTSLVSIFSAERRERTEKEQKSSQSCSDSLKDWRLHFCNQSGIRVTKIWKLCWSPRTASRWRSTKETWRCTSSVFSVECLRPYDTRCLEYWDFAGKSRIEVDTLYPLTVIYCVFAVFGLCGNLATVSVILSNKYMRWGVPMPTASGRQQDQQTIDARADIRICVIWITNRIIIYIYVFIRLSPRLDHKKLLKLEGMKKKNYVDNFLYFKHFLNPLYMKESN